MSDPFFAFLKIAKGSFGDAESWLGSVPEHVRSASSAYSILKRQVSRKQLPIGPLPDHLHTITSSDSDVSYATFAFCTGIHKIAVDFEIWNGAERPVNVLFTSEKRLDAALFPGSYKDQEGFVQFVNSDGVWRIDNHLKAEDIGVLGVTLPASTPSYVATPESPRYPSAFWYDASHGEPSREINVVPELGSQPAGSDYQGASRTSYVTRYASRSRDSNSIWEDGTHEFELCWDVIVHPQQGWTKVLLSGTEPSALAFLWESCGEDCDIRRRDDESEQENKEEESQEEVAEAEPRETEELARDSVTGGAEQSQTPIDVQSGSSSGLTGSSGTATAAQGAQVSASAATAAKTAAATAAKTAAVTAATGTAATAVKAGIFVTIAKVIGISVAGLGVITAVGVGAIVIAINSAPPEPTPTYSDSDS